MQRPGDRPLFDTPGELGKNLRKGLDPNGKTPFGITLLQAGARDGDVAAVRLLIAHGADVDATAPLLRTPLHEAVIGGHTEVCRALLDAGADPNKSHQMFDLPLQQAIVRRNEPIVRLLVARGADPRRIVGAGGTATALDMALASGSEKIIRIISDAAGPLPDPAACKCHRLPRSDLAGPLDGELCLEKILDASVAGPGTRRRYPVYRCRETGLEWEVAGYDERGVTQWAFTLVHDSIPHFLDLMENGTVIATAGYERAQRRRLNP